MGNYTTDLFHDANKVVFSTELVLELNIPVLTYEYLNIVQTQYFMKNYSFSYKNKWNKIKVLRNQ